MAKPTLLAHILGLIFVLLIVHLSDAKQYHKKLDLVFVLDSSASIKAAIYRKNVIGTVKNIVRTFVIGKEHVHVAALHYSNKAILDFNLDSYSKKSDVLKAVSRIAYTPGWTATGDALNLVRTAIVPKMRKQVPKIVVVITDGISNRGVKVAAAAAKLRKLGVIIIGVGVTDDVDDFDMEEMVSKPHTEHYLTVESYQRLLKVSSVVSAATCLAADKTTQPTKQKSVIPKPVPPPKVCKKFVGDIVFVLDSSASVPIATYKKSVLGTVKSFVGDLKVGKDAVRVAVLHYSSTPKLDFNLDKYSKTKDVLKALNDVDYRPGWTATGDALHMALKKIVPKMRANVPKTVIVITDGKSNRGASVYSEANKFHNMKIKVLGVGVTKDVDEDEMHGMVSKPVKEHYFFVESFDKLITMKHGIQSITCKNNAP